mgnify:CR=1 FL=1
MNDSVLQILETAKSLQQKNQLQKAELLYRKVLAQDPENAEALHFLGVIAFQTGHLQQAVQLIEASVKQDSSVPRAHFNLGYVYEASGEKEKALASYFRAAELNPENEKTLRHLERTGPRDAVFFYHLANSYYRIENFESAVECYRKAIEIDEGYVAAYINLGAAYEKQGNRGWLAEECYTNALRLRPDSAAATYNLACLLEKWGQIDKALNLYRKVVELRPEHAEARYSISNIELLKGDLKSGFKNYDWRMQMSEWQQKYPLFIFQKPMWQGEPFKGKTLLVHDEQGFGDAVMFIRYLPLIKELGGQTVLVTRKPLMNLVKNIPGIDRIVERSFDPGQLPAFDLYVFLLSLPGIFQTTFNTIPCQMPYLSADRAVQQKWETVIAQKEERKKYRIGLVWAGQPKHLNDRNRSIPLRMFLPLLHRPECVFVGLQKGERAEEAEDLPEEVQFINPGESFQDFSDTAAVIACLDLVLTVDTSVAHLAGAMGVKVWTLLPFNNDWRWLESGNTSPWYPTMTLFRQKGPDRWEEVINRVAEELSTRLS